MAKKKRKVSLWKKDLWKVFSKYVKLQYADGEYCKCFTCDKAMKMGTSDCQAGHYYPQGGYEFIRFHEDNVRPQCYACNIFLSGNSAIFGRRLLEEIGQERFDWLHDNRKESEVRRESWYIEKIEHYKGLVG